MDVTMGLVDGEESPAFFVGVGKRKLGVMDSG
jgi:hypothetical protein